jgi:thiamine biosynthesis lipoprotein
MRWSVLLTALVLLWGCRSSAPLATLGGETMGTTYSIKIGAELGTGRGRLKRAIDTRLEQINAAMSTYDPASELSQINRRAGGEWIDISEDLSEVLAAALRASRETGGVFDVTVGPLVSLWGFGPEGAHDETPADAKIESARALVGYRRLELRTDGRAIRKERTEVQIDLSAIAPGYAVDEIAELLAARGYGDFVVEIGGEVRARGMHPEGRPWRIGIERPRADRREVAYAVELRDRGLSTSGDYRNVFERGGSRYSHTIDPETGRPVRHALASVTVIADSAMSADALATALMVMGPERGLAFAEARGVPALFQSRGPSGISTSATSALRALDRGVVTEARKTLAL